MQEEIIQDRKFLTFELAGQIYAIEIDRIKEILNGIGKITSVPEFPSYGRGVINLRGDIVPIIDMRRRFKLSEIEITDKICVIVTECGDPAVSEFLGFVVDKVQAVENFDCSQISEPPKIASGTSKYITGVYKADGRIIMIIDPDELLTEQMKTAIGEYMENNQ